MICEKSRRHQISIFGVVGHRHQPVVAIIARININHHHNRQRQTCVPLHWAMHQVVAAAVAVVAVIRAVCHFLAFHRQVVATYCQPESDRVAFIRLALIQRSHQPHTICNTKCPMKFY